MIQIQQDNSMNLAKLDAMLEEDPVKHLYRVDRAAFTDEQLFELELKYIFEGNWVYLAHESQIANVNDFLTVYIGRGKDDVGDVTRVCIGRIAVNIFNRGQNQTCAKRM